MAKANPLKSEGSAQADGMLAVYEVTKILLGHGAIIASILITFDKEQA